MRHAASIAALLCALPGCYESFTLPDGALAPRDSGASRADGAPIEPDGGPITVCGGEIVPDYAGPGCSPSTRECLEACSALRPECPNDCLARDPECTSCFTHVIVQCSNELGCQLEWDAFACCTDRICPDATTGIARLACASVESCERELELYASCVEGDSIDVCEARIESCFASLTP